MTRKLSRSRRRQNPPTIAFEMFNAEIAYDLLADNKNNRKLRDRVVKKYARDMRAGNWLLAGEPILIDSDGKLAGNGQHRLMAVIEADVEVELPVIRNATAEERIVADQGIKRAFSDVLTIQFRETDPVKLAAAVRQVHFYRQSGLFGLTGPDANPTIAELIDTYLTESNLKESILVANRVTHSSSVKASVGVMTALHYIFSEIDPENADAFFERLADGAMLEKTDAIMHVRKYLSSDDRPRLVKIQAAVLIKAFNFWREGKPTMSLRWRAGGAHPEKFPTIDPGEPRRAAPPRREEEEAA